MNRQEKENLAKWIESVSNRVSQDPEAQLEKLGDKIYLTPGYKYAANLRQLSDSLLMKGAGTGSYRATTWSKGYSKFS